MEPKATKRARKSSIADESDNESVIKKRGRKSAVKIDSNEDDEDEESLRNRKPRKPLTKGLKSDEPQQPLHDMAKYMEKQSWEQLVDTIDTVERADDGLIIYFTL